MKRKIYCDAVDCKYHDKSMSVVCNANHIHINLNSPEFELHGSGLSKAIKLKSTILHPICSSYKKINEENSND